MFTVGAFEFDPDKFMKNIGEDDDEEDTPIRRFPGVRKKRITKKEKQRGALEQQGYNFRRDIPEEVLDCLLNCLCSSCKKKLKSSVQDEDVKKKDADDLEKKIQNLFPDSQEDEYETDFEESDFDDDDDGDDDDDEGDKNDFLDFLKEPVKDKKGTVTYHASKEDDDDFNLSNLFSRKGIKKFVNEKEELPAEGIHFLKRNAYRQKDPEPETKPTRPNLPIQSSEPFEEDFGSLFPKFSK